MAKLKLSEAAREFFREAGRRAVKARMKKLTPEQRTDIARAAAKARWAKVKNEKMITVRKQTTEKIQALLKIAEARDRRTKS